MMMGLQALREFSNRGLFPSRVALHLQRQQILQYGDAMCLADFFAEAQVAANLITKIRQQFVIFSGLTQVTRFDWFTYAIGAIITSSHQGVGIYQACCGSAFIWSMSGRITNTALIQESDFPANKVLLIVASHSLLQPITVTAPRLQTNSEGDSNAQISH